MQMNYFETLIENLSELNDIEFDRIYSLLCALGGTEEQMQILEAELLKRNKELVN